MDRKWTLFDVSLRTMIQPSVLSQYERGKLEVSPERAHLLAELFGVPVSEFWTPPTLADVAYPGVANG
ncbi:MAG: helix-turn-helix transcriptional regulator [Candidatus Hydrogenedentes bacterium]|nr:helix-turn-helix transcriptional regulator [Candidatus Hydrogenedentota bacterium]